MFVCFSMYLSCFFFFKQKTAYEMRISDWSSDVCSSDRRRAFFTRQFQRHLPAGNGHLPGHAFGERAALGRTVLHAEHGNGGTPHETTPAVPALTQNLRALLLQRQAVALGSASRRERVCQFV